MTNNSYGTSIAERISITQIHTGTVYQRALYLYQTGAEYIYEQARIK